MDAKTRRRARIRRHVRVRRKISGTAERPRLAVYRSNRHIYAQLVDEVKRDFNTDDYYQGGYLINQAVNELCPAQIWQLRQAAGGYTLPA